MCVCACVCTLRLKGHSKKRLFQDAHTHTRTHTDFQQTLYFCLPNTHQQRWRWLLAWLLRWSFLTHTHTQVKIGLRVAGLSSIDSHSFWYSGPPDQHQKGHRFDSNSCHALGQKNKTLPAQRKNTRLLTKRHKLIISTQIHVQQNGKTHSYRVNKNTHFKHTSTHKPIQTL